jgi:ankyrin repeat protein
MLATTADIASCLLDNGADIERQCTEGSMALHLACKNGQLAVVRLLLKWGAEQHILKSDKGCATALNVAFVFDEVEIFMLLLQHLFEQADFDINHPMLVLDQPLVCAAAGSGMSRVVEAALDHGAFINATGPDGTALLQAARAGHYDTVSLLCERGADVNARSGSLQVSSLEAANRGGACACYQEADQTRG